ncbi:MAG: hypothetical protein WA121_04310 [Syntrophales bacterium]
MNTFNNNRSHFSPFIKGAAILILLIEWYACIFVDFNRGEAMPFSFESNLFNKSNMSHEIINGNLMFRVGGVGQNIYAVFVCLEDSIQFGVKRFKQLLPIYPGSIFIVHAEAEQTAQQSSNDSQEPTGIIAYTIAQIFYIFGHIIYGLILLSPIWVSIYFMFTQR